MSLFDDFLNGRAVVECKSSEESKSFLNMIGTRVRWGNGNLLTDFIPPGYVCYIIPSRELGGARNGCLYTVSNEWASRHGFDILNFSDVIEEQSREIPSPLSLLFTKEVSNEPA